MTLALPVAVLSTLVAHVAPSLDENNRYAKLVLGPDEVRVAITVYLGERPGAAERRRMDRDRDGRLSDDEARRFARSLLDEFAPALVVELDGRPAAAAERPDARWTLADVGLGSATVAAGAFSVDLELRVPVPGPGPHALWFEDRFPLPRAGESEVLVDAAPGVQVVAAHRGREGTGIVLRHAGRGTNGFRGEGGVLVRFEVDPAFRSSPAPGANRAPRPRWALGAALLVLAAAGAALGARWRAQRRRGGGQAQSRPRGASLGEDRPRGGTRGD